MYSLFLYFIFIYFNLEYFEEVIDIIDIFLI